MGKLTREFKGDFEKVINYCKDSILGGSISAHIEDEAYLEINDMKVALLIFERYSWIGSSRLSLTLNIIGVGDEINLCAITSGGSQAMFFKVNTFGEEAFLDNFEAYIDRYIDKENQKY